VYRPKNQPTASADPEFCVSRLPQKTDAEHDAALAEWNCVHLGPQGCEVYEERPLICRLFGTTSSLPCPRGSGPDISTDTLVEKQVHQLIASTRQVLV